MDRRLNSPASDDLRGSLLVVDDMSANLRVLAKLLTRAGHEVRPALSGPVALEAARSLLPDLVLLDVHMPEMDGYQVCAAFKEDPRLHEIPIIFVSAAGDTRDKVRAFEQGAVDYVTKPFDADEVLARVQTHLALSYSRREQQAFGRMVAHDISNPLTQIILQVEAGLIDGQMPIREMLAIKQSAQSIQAIVRSMLVLSKLHQQDVESEPVEMVILLHQTQRMLQRLLTSSHASLYIADDMPPALGYQPWIEQVWTNYITNAIKYGGRPPRIELDWTPAEDGMIKYLVRDNGPGLTADEQAVVFNEFTRLNHIGTDGHGLGLAIVQRVVSRMGGVVGLTSTPGKGSTFYFCLPSA